jgi:hypothetical protein
MARATYQPTDQLRPAGWRFIAGTVVPQKLLLRPKETAGSGLMSQFGSMRFLLVSVVFALFFGSVAIALSASFEEGRGAWASFDHLVGAGEDRGRHG